MDKKKTTSRRGIDIDMKEKNTRSAKNKQRSLVWILTTFPDQPQCLSFDENGFRRVSVSIPSGFRQEPVRAP